ncbi:unnamed protein product [Closterium sp. NIES-53]
MSLLMILTPSTAATPTKVPRFPPPSPLPRPHSSSCSRSSDTPTPPRSCHVKCVSCCPSPLDSTPGVVSLTTVVLIVTAATFSIAVAGRIGRWGFWCWRWRCLLWGAGTGGAGSGGAGAGGAGSEGAGVGGAGTGGDSYGGAGAGGTDSASPAQPTHRYPTRHQRPRQLEREEQERLAQERLERERLEQEKEQQEQQQQQPLTPQPSRLQQLFPPVSGLRALGLPSSPPDHSPPPTAHGLPLLDSSLAVFSPPRSQPPPPAVTDTWTTRCRPGARPSSPVSDLRCALFHSSPPRSPP